MATTQNGLPYPVGTDKVVDGDNAIKALAEALNGLGKGWNAYRGSTDQFPPNSWISVLDYTIPDAAPGLYLIFSTFVVTVPAGVVIGYERLQGNGTGLGPDMQNNFDPNWRVTTRPALYVQQVRGPLKVEQFVQVTGANNGTVYAATTTLFIVGLGTAH